MNWVCFWVRIGFGLGSLFFGKKLVFHCKSPLQQKLEFVFGRFAIGFVLGSYWVRLGSLWSCPGRLLSL